MIIRFEYLHLKDPMTSDPLGLVDGESEEKGVKLRPCGKGKVVRREEEREEEKWEQSVEDG